MQFHPIPLFKHQAGGHKPLHQLISNHLQSGNAKKGRTEPCKPRRNLWAFHFSAREGSMCEMKPAHTCGKGAGLWWKANRAIKDSVLMQKVLAALQSFLSDHFCYTYSRKKGRFNTAESLSSVTGVIWTWKEHLPTARKHNVPTLTNAKICRPPGAA